MAYFVDQHPVACRGSGTIVVGVVSVVGVVGVVGDVVVVCGGVGCVAVVAVVVVVVVRVVVFVVGGYVGGGGIVAVLVDLGGPKAVRMWVGQNSYGFGWGIICMDSMGLDTEWIWVG